MKKLLVLGVLAALGYGGWQRYQERRDTAPDVAWASEQTGREVNDAYLIFEAFPMDGRVLEVEGPAGANLIVMTSRMGYHFHKTNPDLVIICRTPGAGDMINALGAMTLVSDNPRGRRELDRMVGDFKERSRLRGKRPCLKLEGNELADPRFQFRGGVPGKLVRVTRFETMDSGELIAGM
jgi:hypothetical protein